MTATWKQLRSGAWGVMVTGPTPKPGERISVVKRSGESRTVTLGSLVFEGPGVSYWTIRSDGSIPGRVTKGDTRGRCAECGRPGELVEDLEDGLMKHHRCCDIPPNLY